MIIFYYDIEKTKWAKTLYVSQDSEWVGAWRMAEEEMRKNPHILSYDIKFWLSNKDE